MPYESVFMQGLFFCDWLILLSIMSFSFNFIVANGNISFFLRLNKIPQYHIPHFHYPFIFEGQLGCFSILSIVNKTATNMEVQMSPQDPNGHLFLMRVIKYDITCFLKLKCKMISHRLFLFSLFLGVGRHHYGLN
jgi:hypothetical protein